MPVQTSRSSAPSVTVIVLNYNGERHLRACLPSLEALDYPKVSLAVANNGSADGSLAYVKQAHKQVRVIEMGANLGFAPAYNRAVAEVRADYVALLNNDTRVAPTWLSELVDAADRHGVAAAASAIVDWDGRQVDFVGGLPTAIGHSWQIDHGEPVGRDYPERRLLFGCGGSVLIRREAFAAAGGFDEDFFAYFEDVDLGWRMNLLGHATVFAPRATTFHRLHGTFGATSNARRLRLYERNALAMICKNYGDEALGRVLPMAVALTLARNLEPVRLEGAAIHFGAAEPRHAIIPANLVATLIGLEDFGRRLPSIRHKRAGIQGSRRVSDEEILRLMPEPLRLHDLGDRYRETAHALIRDFRIAEIFGLPSPPLSIQVGAVSSPAAGPPSDRARARSTTPLVSVIVLTASGATHLPECLESLRRHSWPADATELIVVDNGSDEDPTMVAERHYPGVRVVRTGRNIGFSAGNNAGVRVATGEYIVFLNDDTKVAANWLDELMAVAERRQAACVGALMLDWPGERIDFAGGLVNFEGRGFALHYDEPVTAGGGVESPILFACGGAVLFSRDAFESSGGWDEPTFAYYEDVEFGWRLWLLGHEVWLAPKAIVYHKHHGTSGKNRAARARAFERNGLRMVYSLLEETRLRRVLPAALLLAADRVLLSTPFSRAAESASDRRPLALPNRETFAGPFRHALIQRGARKSLGVSGSLKKVGVSGVAGAMWDAARETVRGINRDSARTRYLIEIAGVRGSPDGRRERAPATAVAALLGVQDFLGMLPELSARRAWLQARRKRTDAEILERFGGRWTNAVPSPRGDLHNALREQLMEVLGL